METTNVEIKRPVFLTIICIISFVGLGITMMKSLVSVAFGQLMSTLYPLAQGGMEDSLDQIRISDPQIMPFVENIFDSVLKLLQSLPLLAILTFAVSGVALAGVILMWNLRKSGFYMFCAAKVIEIFLPMMLIGANFISMIIGSASFMIAAVFITLYALNFKALK